MATNKIESITLPAPGPGRVRQKSRTRRLLLETAGRLLAAGHRPSVTDTADAAGVSRRTAYRYFPTAAKLHADAVLDTLRPVMESALENAAANSAVVDIEDRVATLVENMQRLAVQNETLLRTMIHETVLSAVPPDADRPRGGRRLEWIDSAVLPLRPRIGAEAYKKLRSALALCTGIESLLVLRDICGLSVKESIVVSQWMCRALVRESLAQRNRESRTRAKITKTRGRYE